jgi:hypothetical protein
MIARVGSGWQTVLADLSLILFMVTASAVAQADGIVVQADASPRAEPLAFYVPGKDAPTLRQWLAEQGGDGRQMLTIVASYRPGRRADALANAAALAGEMEGSDTPLRVVVEPGEGGVHATLAYDAPEATLARRLQNNAQQPQGDQLP